MKCAWYKYNTLLDKGEWETPDAQGKEIFALRAGINGLKRVKTQTHDKKTASRGKKNKRGRNDDGNKNMTKQKRDYSWNVIAPKGKEPTSLTKFSKTYHWFSTETGAPKVDGCYRWVCHKLSTYEGLSKKRDPQQGATSDAPSKKRCSHTLHVREDTVILEQTKLINDESDFASTPEPNDPNGPNMSPDHKSSEESENMDLE